MIRSPIAVALLVFAVSASALAQDGETPEAPAVASSETEKLVALEGETIRVTGFVEETGRSNSGNQFLNFADSDFVAVTFRTDLTNFTEGEPADLFAQKTVAITGPIKVYKGIPEIILSQPTLIEIIKPAEAVVPAPEPEPVEEPAPAPPAPEPETPPAKEPKTPPPPAKKPPVDWRLYFPQ